MWLGTIQDRKLDRQWSNSDNIHFFDDPVPQQLAWSRRPIPAKNLHTI